MASDESFSDFFYAARDGLKLHARIYGGANSDGWPVVCLPGLTRNARDFHELALYLSSNARKPRKVIAFDYRGRGQSDYDPDISHYNVGVEAGDVLAGLSELGIEEAAFIGTSRGGLIIHVLGALKPAVLKAIVLNDIGPVVEAEGLAHIRSYLDRNPKPNTFSVAVDAQRRVHGASFPALIDADWARMVTAICRDTDAGWVPDFDPALVDTMAGTDFSKPLPDLWPQFDALAAVPMLAIRGANSRILSVETLEQMQKRHPGMETMTVDGQGHAAFLETVGLPEAIAGFLDRTERKAQQK
ncbi:alpha/beta hydrolase [Mesorhizobium tamadayense]|uniref:Alpha/beta hydrolase n=1 Tax=Mesorhizobium tamadayense TaxID=425306 RepID=A0A3P3G4Q2_9HYPH|nr:alpha/beta hydrolase [Mesorhizobium tamadayense]RRI05846.1 alpha/beta hydrolase [Mesorhizobium tamadayense]